MGLISAFTIIRSLSLFHLTVGYYLLTSPRTIVEQNVVFIFGEAMRLPHTTALNTPSPATSFLGLVFVFLGISDLTAVSLSPEISTSYWSSITPIRLIFLFVLTGYTYLFKSDGMFGSGAATTSARRGLGGAYVKGGNAGAGENLKNSLVFTWAFLELAAWFWVFVTVREERRKRAIELLEKRRKEAESY